MRRDSDAVGGCAPTEFCQNAQRNEGEPKRSEENKSSGGKRVAFPPSHHPGDNLRNTAVTNAHRQNHRVEFVKTGIVKVEQHRSHAETEETQRSWIASNVAGFVHGISLPKTRSTMQSQSAL